MLYSKPSQQIIVLINQSKKILSGEATKHVFGKRKSV